MHIKRTPIYAGFFMNWSSDGPMCSSVGWTVQVDVHGYIAIVILFALTHKVTYGDHRNTLIKKVILITWYVSSLLYVLFFRPLPWQRLNQDAVASMFKYGMHGVDLLTRTQIVFSGVEECGGKHGLYPNFDFDNDAVASFREYRQSVAIDTYFTSITAHGSAALLGSLLYLMLYERQGQPSRPGWKLAASLFLLIITKGWFSVSGLPMYFLLDAILTMKPSKDATNGRFNTFWSTLASAIVKFLSHPLFKSISPYTYGIYMFHLVVMLARFKATLPAKVTAIQNAASSEHACSALEAAGYGYGIPFIWKETLISFGITLVMAIALHWSVEWPFNWLRKRWLPTKPCCTTSSSSAKNSTVKSKAS
jgi:hypothetical protein